MAKFEAPSIDNISESPSSTFVASHENIVMPRKTSTFIFSLFAQNASLVYKIFDGSHQTINHLTFVFAMAIIVGFISSFMQSVPSFRYFRNFELLIPYLKSEQ